MCQPLSYAEFRWVEDELWRERNRSGSPIGYILEVDLEYPQHLYDQHTDLPFCLTCDKPPGKREDKLLAMFYDKQRYVIHYPIYQLLAMYSSSRNKDPPGAIIRSISMAPRLHWTQYTI